MTRRLLEDSEPNARRPRECCQLSCKLRSMSMPSRTERTCPSLWQEPSSRSSAETTSRTLWSQSSRFSTTPRSARARSMILFLLEDPQESQWSRSCWPSSSTESSWTDPSTQTRLLPTELPYKPLYWTRKRARLWTRFSCWMSPHCLWELRLPAESWPRSLRRTPPFQSRRLRSLPPMLTTSQESRFRFTKEKDQWLRTITSLEPSTWTALPQLQEEFLRSRSHLI